MRRRDEVLGRRFVRMAKARWRSFCLADAGREPLTYGETLVASLLLSGWIRRRAAGERFLGLLLPSSVGGALANIAATMAGKIVVNLNFTAGAEAMDAALARCGIGTIVTSRIFVAKAGIAHDSRMVFLEDILPSFGQVARLRMLAVAFLLPAGLLNRWYVTEADGESPATVVFSSGSTGLPKGVLLAHRNILANVEAVCRIFDVRSTDVMLGVLPFFHSFGFTGTLWLPLLAGLGVVYHGNPTDARAIGELAGRHRATMLISTPTFCAIYARKCRPQEFAHLRYVIVGAEKLRAPVAAAFRERFGVTLLEGYGCTEMAPVVSVNRPDSGSAGGVQRGAVAGTVGQPLPGVTAKVVHPETGEGPLFGEDGLLLVNGPNRMMGYLGEPERTADVLRDGWYVTGDIASIDDQGFIRITDRLSRFSKIGGEMVPHLRIEECVDDMLGESYRCAVTSVPDDLRGERIVVLFTDPGLAAQALWDRLTRTELPRLWLPKRDDVLFVESIPTLGTGKTDLRAVRQMAIERTTLT